MSQLKRNIVANLIGRGWASLLLLASIPFYIKFIGVEAIGLIGFFFTLQAVFSLLDIGLSTTLNREAARFSVREGKAHEIRDLVRTLELVYLAVAVAIACMSILLSPLVSRYWFQFQHLSANSAHQAVLMMGVAIAVQFPFMLYSSGLLGLQQQVLLNKLVIAISTIRGLGALLILWLISPTIQSFFGWQIFVGLLQTTLSAVFLWRSLPASQTAPQFRKALLYQNWRFAAGLTGITFLAVLLTQLDKIILSKVLTLEMFGYYSLATLAASGLSLIIGPIFSAVFPQLCQLVSLGDEEVLTSFYHRSAQLMSVLMLPAAIVTSAFAREILMTWTQDSIIAEKTYFLLTLLIIGTALNGMMHVPYALQLSYGWTKLSFYQNLVAVILLIPMLLWATRQYGAIGAAITWVILNAGSVLITIQVMHRRLLKQEKLRWYYQDIGLPLASGLLVGLVGRWLLQPGSSAGMALGWMILILLLSFLASTLSAPYTRGWIIHAIQRVFIHRLSGKVS